MDLPSTIHYETIARAFQVIDIALPIEATETPAATIEEVAMSLGNYVFETPSEDPTSDLICIIRDESRIHGYIAFGDDVFGKDDWSASIESSDITPINPSEIVPDSLPILDLIPLFQQRHHFFVLTKNEITHHVTFDSVDKLPVRLSLFSLIMALEAAMINFLSQSPDKYLAMLPSRRLQKARDVYQLKYNPQNRPTHKVDPKRLLLCTTIAAKADILLRESSAWAMPLIGGKNELVRIFKQIEEMRNQIAHSDTIFTVTATPSALVTFISRVRALTHAISNL